MRFLRTHTWNPCRPLLLLFLAISGLPAHGSSQTFLGTVSEVLAGERLGIRLTTDVRQGILAFVVSFSEEYQDWLPKAEIALERVVGTSGEARILSQEAPIAVGDRVAIFEAVLETGISLRVRPSNLRLIAGETADLTAELVDSEGNTLQSVMARWMSSNDRVVTVNEVGRVVGQESGRATVTAAGPRALVGAVAVDVLEPSFRVPDSLTTFLGTGEDTIKIVLTSAPGMTVPPTSFQWTSSDDAVASVNRQGVVAPRGVGFVRVTAEGYGQRLVIPVRVYERSANVFFQPAEDIINLVSGEFIEPSASVAMVGGSRLEGLYPEILAMDSVFLARGEGGRIVAVREGTVLLRVRAAGTIKDWTVRVHPPGVKIDLDSKALPLGGSLQLSASLINLTGIRLGEALGTRWTSRSPDIVEIQGSRAIARSAGKARLVAQAGTSADSAEVFVLGNLLVTVQSGRDREIKTVSFATGQVLPLSDGGLKGWSPSLSPDGTTIVFISTGTGVFPRLHLADAVGGNVRRVSGDFQGPFGSHNPLYQEHDPTWTPDGSRILFSSNHQGTYNIHSIRPDGSDLRRLSFEGAVERRPAAVRGSPRIAYERWLGAGKPSIVIGSLDGAEGTHLHGRSLQGQIGLYQGRPILLGAGTEALMIQTMSRASSAVPEKRRLARVDLSPMTNPEFRTRLLDFDLREELIYALSPDERFVAYTLHSGLQMGGTTITVIALDPAGRVVATVNLSSGEVVTDLTWATNLNIEPRGQESNR